MRPTHGIALLLAPNYLSHRRPHNTLNIAKFFHLKVIHVQGPPAAQ